MAVNPEREVILAESEKSPAADHTSSDPSIDVDPQPQPNKESPVRFYLLFIALGVAVFVGGLDANLFAPAVPAITDSFGSTSDAGWYGTAYYLSLSCCQMAWAQIYRAFPAKPVFFTGLLIFLLGTLVGALAPSSAAVIVGRAISGAGMSGCFVGGLIIVSYIITLRWRPIITAIFALVIGSTMTAGPVVGGALTSRLSWHWCFWVSLPIGGFSLLLAPLGSPVKDPEGKRDGFKQLIEDFDMIGFALWVLAVICLTLILQFGGTRYEWTGGQLITLYVVTPLLFALFAFHQVRLGDRALVPGRIIKQRSVACSALYVLFMQTTKAQITYFLPIFFQAAQNKTALESGVDTIPSFLSYFTFQILANLAVSWLGLYAPFMLVGSLIGTAGTALLSLLTTSTPAPRWIGYQILALSGFGIGFNGPQIAAQTVFQDPEDVPTALTIITTCQDLGGSLGVSIGSAIFTNLVRQRVQSVIPNITADQILNAGITRLQDMVAPDQRSSIAEAYAYGVRVIFYGSTAFAAATFILACFVEWKSVKDKPEDSGRR
ncbi:major facilitator superfamily domain-containing protein [Hypoxylon sp. FL0890]|nr:major facilitator superfamily domain-containing protein [Hypoxylon sp. FL0890]